MNRNPAQRPRVVIVGGGMGGIAAAKTLADAPVEITLVDRHNYYLFQPLLYEVAGAIVNTEDITHAIRGLLRGQANIRCRLATATGVDLELREVTLQDGDRLGYEYLILATGLRSDVARVPGAAEHAFPMKTLEDALGLRNHLLRRLETAAAHPELVPAGALDIAIVGGSTTGVEVVAAFSEIYNHALRQEFPEIDFTQTKITLIEAGETLLPMFHPNLRRWVEKVLTHNGTEIRLRSPVAEIGPASVTLENGEEIPAGTIIVATGVRATALADRLGIAQTAGGRISVDPALSIPGHPDAFAIGDMAALPTSEGALHPALAQFALQGGRHAARQIVRQIEGKPTRPFRYWDKGMTSMVGYNAAILQSGRVRLTGKLGFFLWGALHGYYVPGLRNRLSLRLTWLWSWATRRRAALLLIEGPATPARREETADLPPPRQQSADVASGRS
ncbi:MAG TPA: NAD(P)/FAD-dependent oxidoreductase [Gaiellales bacterium]|nr:NAD(P)/FAD-dependent oxidoreductase [Gaiellales bacterium]